MFFNSFDEIVRLLVVGPIIYVALVLILRVAGKRSLAKMNAFDFVVTVALGSTLATVLLSKDVALAEGVAAFVVLLTLQMLVSFAAVRLGWFRRLVKSEPSVLVVNGRIDEHELRHNRVAVEEIHQALRSSGVGSLDLAAAVVLETDGSMSVITNDKAGRRDVLPEAARS